MRKNFEQNKNYKLFQTFHMQESILQVGKMVTDATERIICFLYYFLEFTLTPTLIIYFGNWKYFFFLFAKHATVHNMFYQKQ